MIKAIHALLLGLAGAGIVHVAALLLIPAYSQNDAWARLGTVGADYSFALLPAPQDGAQSIRTIDPLFATAACRFDLRGGIAVITQRGRVPFWSVSVFDRRGQNIYSFNDRNAVDGELDLVIATPLQMLELRKETPDEFFRSVLVEADMEGGFVVLRAFLPDASWREIAERFVREATCEAA